MSNFFEDLETQLQAAAQARAGGSRLHAGRRLGRLGGALSIAATVAVTVAVVAVILTVGHGHGRPPSAGHHPPLQPPSQSAVASYLNHARRVTASRDRACGGAPRMFQGRPTTFSERTPSRALLLELAVLRRPATAADRLPRRYFRGLLPFGGVVYERYIRRARVVDGVSYFLIPGHVEPSPGETPPRCYAEERAALQNVVPPPPAGQRAAILRAADQILARERQSPGGLPAEPFDGVTTLTVGPGAGGAGCCATASNLMSNVSIGSVGQTFNGIVPDRVAFVSFYFAKTASQNPLTIIAHATHAITATVSSNMYVLNPGKWGRPAAVAYLSANRTVLRRFNTNQ